MNKFKSDIRSFRENSTKKQLQITKMYIYVTHRPSYRHHIAIISSITSVHPLSVHSMNAVHPPPPLDLAQPAVRYSRHRHPVYHQALRVQNRQIESMLQRYASKYSYKALAVNSDSREKMQCFQHKTAVFDLDSRDSDFILIISTSSGAVIDTNFDS